jgi:hypothetical protein
MCPALGHLVGADVAQWALSFLSVYHTPPPRVESLSFGIGYIPRMEMGAKLELCAMGPLMGPAAHYEWMRHWREVKIQETAAVVKEIGGQNFILGGVARKGTCVPRPIAASGQKKRPRIGGLSRDVLVRSRPVPIHP